jgi:hypothetical protein
MTPRELEEYRALRATIRERGTARVWAFMAGLTAWAAFTIATMALADVPVATLLPLLVLAGAFEAVFALHTGVERIGRYIQVFLEDEANDSGWEQRIMKFGAMGRLASSDPLFTIYFLTAALFNFVPVLLAGAVPVEYGVVGALHVLFIARLVLARRTSGRQRAIDLERFQRINSSRREP